MSKYERRNDDSDSLLPATDQIQKFNLENADDRNLGGWGEEMANCSRVVKNLVRTDSLTKETLLGVFERAHNNIPTGAIYLLAYRVIEEAAESGKLNAEILGVVEESVMADKDPLWSVLGKQEERNKFIMQQLLTNEHLFELMLPYLV